MVCAAVCGLAGGGLLLAKMLLLQRNSRVAASHKSYATHRTRIWHAALEICWLNIAATTDMFCGVAALRPWVRLPTGMHCFM